MLRLKPVRVCDRVTESVRVNPPGETPPPVFFLPVKPPFQFSFPPSSFLSFHPSSFLSPVFFPHPLQFSFPSFLSPGESKPKSKPGPAQAREARKPDMPASLVSRAGSCLRDFFPSRRECWRQLDTLHCSCLQDCTAACSGSVINAFLQSTLKLGRVLAATQMDVTAAKDGSKEDLRWFPGAQPQSRLHREDIMRLPQVQERARLQECRHWAAASRARACLESCRKSLRADCKVLRFCCFRHLEQCKLATPPQRKRGPREVLTPDQIAHLLKVFCKDGAPWAAVAALLQLTVAERGSCILHCRFRWLQNLGPDSAGAPAMDIEQVNKKTVGRRVPIPGQLASLLHKWINEQPLQGNGSQWPFQGQGRDSDAFLFPSANVQGERLWDRCMTRQAFHLRIQRACRVIQQQRGILRRQRVKGPLLQHPFKDMDMGSIGSQSFKRSSPIFECVDLNNIGTHTFKRSSITLLKPCNP